MLAASAAAQNSLKGKKDDLPPLPSEPGVVTPATLASNARKSAANTPKKKKVSKSMTISCYADDPKEPELIGEVVVVLDEALKKGEVDGECGNTRLTTRMVRVLLQGQVQRGGIPRAHVLLERGAACSAQRAQAECVRRGEQHCSQPARHPDERVCDGHEPVYSPVSAARARPITRYTPRSAAGPGGSPTSAYCCVEQLCRAWAASARVVDGSSCSTAAAGLSA